MNVLNWTAAASGKSVEWVRAQIEADTPNDDWAEVLPDGLAELWPSLHADGRMVALYVAVEALSGYDADILL